MKFEIQISCSCRELLESMQAATLEPEVAFLNASLVMLLNFTYLGVKVFSFALSFPKVKSSPI